MPARMRPVTMVAIAPQRNQNSAVGAITLLMAGFCSSGIFGMDGVCTKLKYQSRPIHMTPLMMWNQRKANSHHSCVRKIMAFPPIASGEGANEEMGDPGQNKSQQHGLSQRVQRVLHCNLFPVIVPWSNNIIEIHPSLGNRRAPPRVA